MSKQTVMTAENTESFWGELAEYRQLLWYFTWREFKLRYKQSYLGVLWIVLQPLMFAAIISIVLVRRGELTFGFENANDVVVIFLSFSLWQFFEASFSGAIKGINSSKNLAKKVYVPSIIFVLGPIFSRFADLTLKLIVFVFLAIITGSEIHYQGFIYLVFVCALLALIAASVGMILGPINVRFKDVSLTLPFFTRMMFFSAPIWYPFTLIPEEYRQIFLINPIVSTMELVRNGLFDPSAVTAQLIIYPLVEVIFLIAIGIPIFKKTKRLVADYF